MRILFLSGTAVGGSAMSTRELAERMAARGHEVDVLLRVETAPRRWMLQHRLVNLAVRLPTLLAQPVWSIAGLIGGHRRLVNESPVRVWSTILPENSLRKFLRDQAPDVVVSASIGRMAWRSIREELSAAEIASVLYLREEAAIGHLDISNAPPDLLLANAATLTERAAAIGFSAQFVPSVVSLDGIRVDTTREVVLFINPVEISGRGVAVALARECPETRFAFLESWPLKPEERRWLADSLVGLANVELRPRTDDPNELYGDAAVLLAPYLTNGRPRVVLEAQANGVPVLGSSLDALVEAIGPGGLTVDADAPIAEWATALRYLLSPTNYDGFVAAARTYSERSEVDPEMIVGEFETLLLELMTTRGGAS